MLTTNCPYCNHPEMPEPSDGPRPFGICPSCHKASRAEIIPIDQGARNQVRYVRTAYGQGKTKIVPFRPDPDNLWLLDESNRSETINQALRMFRKLYYGAV